MRNYEIMFIVNPNTSEEDIDKVILQMSGVVTAGGGTVQKAEKLGKRRLAYSVQKFNDGYYVLFTLSADGSIIREFERRLRVQDAVIKYLTVLMDDEIRRVGRIKRHRVRRAAKRSAGRTAVASSEPAAVEESLG